MTVADLIERLKKLPQEAKVQVEFEYDGGGGCETCGYGGEVTSTRDLLEINDLETRVVLVGSDW